MDLNQLLNAHQRAVMESSTSSEKTANRTQSARVADYADRIKRLREHHASESTDELESWESEGGSMPASEMALPPGVTMTMRPEYRVGRYVYSDLNLAVAELERQTKHRSP
ncbi:hypothetical protein OIK40_08900 [Erythrobacter sp. sf7]|uniref:Uncharacterized protein n=1 Tax=Erythrobacter fulvus TaxID=2987523 RepID=A0ABT5JQ36_9SPHN|nr:hypothetical protein [Erythrobacter fulvus]MDC8754758.1 hypothetical protein [Erythrobacter fulvus]